MADLAPRFYLLVVPLPFFFIGNLADIIWKKSAFIAKIFFIVIIIFLSYLNFIGIKQRFWELSEAGKKPISISRRSYYGRTGASNLKPARKHCS